MSNNCLHLARISSNAPVTTVCISSKPISALQWGQELLFTNHCCKQFAHPKTCLQHCVIQTGLVASEWHTKHLKTRFIISPSCTFWIFLLTSIPPVAVKTIAFLSNLSNFSWMASYIPLTLSMYEKNLTFKIWIKLQLESNSRKK